MLDLCWKGIIRRRTGIRRTSDRHQMGIGQASDGRRTGVDRRQTGIGWADDYLGVGVGEIFFKV